MGLGSRGFGVLLSFVSKSPFSLLFLSSSYIILDEGRQLIGYYWVWGFKFGKMKDTWNTQTTSAKRSNRNSHGLSYGGANSMSGATECHKEHCSLQLMLSHAGCW